MSGVYTIQIKSSDIKDEFDFNTTTVKNLSDSGVLKSKIISGNRYFENNSVNTFRKSFNRDDYYLGKEVMEVLKDNGLSDTFKPFFEKGESVKGKRIRCKYTRLLKSFPISISTLTKNNLLKVDTNFSPMLIRKSSVVTTIKTLKGMRMKGL